MSFRRRKNEPVAEVVKEKKKPCAFCKRTVDDEISYGKLYAIGDIQCHYFCVLLSCCLVQKGNDTVGLLGFLYNDILAEVARAKKHKCSYCLNFGASIGCCFPQCRKQFHLPCGRERNTVSLFFDNYKSYCQLHAPKQKIPENIMAKARLRKRFATKGTAKRSIVEQPMDLEAVCVICYEEVDGYPTTETFWPPCCGKDAWFHRTCLQRMSLSAGMHYLKCPLCNDKENFYRAVKGQGYYIPDRDAAWELEQNAYAEIYERPVICNAVECECTLGRSHDAENGPWEIKLCILCGSSGIHAQCQSNSDSANANSRYVCATCQPAAPADLETLAESLEAVILAEQTHNTTRTRHGPVMPSRMSLRRTKGRASANAASASNSGYNNNLEDIKETTKSTAESRRELNLKPLKRLPLSPQKVNILSSSPNTSPTKLLEHCLKERRELLDIKMVLNESVVENVRRKLLKPRPLKEKTRIVNKILDKILSNVEEPLKERHSPIKCIEIKENLTADSTLSSELSEPFQHEIYKTKPETPTDINCDPERHTLEIENEISMNNVQQETLENDVDSKAFSIIKLTIDENNQTPFLETPKFQDDIDELHVEENSQITDMPKISEQENTDSKTVIDLNMFDMNEKSTNSTISDTNELTYESNIIVNEACDPESVVVKDLHEILHTESPIEDSNEVSNKENLFNNTIAVSAYKNLDEDVHKHLEEDLQIFSSTKTLKTIDIENDSSIEISKDNQIINIDVVKMDSNTDNFKLPALKSPVKNKKCFLKFSATDKEILQNTTFNLDLDSFKNHYLNEVDGDRSKNKDVVNINTDIGINRRNLRKRKLEGGMKKSKKRKVDQNSTINNNVSKEVTCLNTPLLDINGVKQEIKTENENSNKEDIKKFENTPAIEQNSKTRRRKRTKDNKRMKRNTTKSKDTSVKLSLKKKNKVQVAIGTKKSNRKTKKIKTKLSIRNKKLELKIKWREERFNLRITELKRKRKLDKNKKCFKQYVLKYNVGDTNFIAKPDGEVSPPKRKYIKQEKPQDKLVQTSIESFFKKLP